MNQSSESRSAASYGDGCAEFYDEIYSSVSSNVIRALSDLAAGGRVLDLGVGTGRIALPLAARGVNVYGVEASAAMIAKLREKPGGSEIPVVKGNFADIRFEESFSLVFSLVSTFFLLRSSGEQQRCFQNVSQMLSKPGLFLLETFKPIGTIVETGESDCAGKVFKIEQIINTRFGTRRYRSELCYAAPEELDQMAQTAGLRLKERWRNWHRQPAGSTDSTHISLYERADQRLS